MAVPTHRRSRPGLVFRRCVLPADERTVHEGIPITTVARTLLEAAATESPSRLRQMIAVAEARDLADSPSLAELLERYPGIRGAKALRGALAALQDELGIANRELELRFADFIEEWGLPHPRTNARVEVAGSRILIVDCLWPDRDLVAELDSRRHHGDWEAAEADRARDAALVAVGLRVVRITWRRLHGARHELATELGAALGVHVARGMRG